MEETPPAQLVEEAGQAVGRSIGGVARCRGRHSQQRRGVSPKGPRRGGRPNIPSCYRARRYADQPGAAPATSSTWHPPAAQRFDSAEADRDCHPDHPPRRLHRRGRHGIPRRCRRLQLLRERPSQPRGGPRRPRVRPADDRVRPHRRLRAGEARRAQARDRRLLGADAGGPRRDDRDRGQGLLGEPGLRLRRVRCGHGRHDQRPAPRRLDDHPAARPRPPPPAERLRGQPRGAQDPRDHPVDPPDPGLPGREGQAADHHGVPEPELLRQPVVWREGRCRAVLRQGARRAHARGGGDPRRDPPVADEVRPDQERRAGLRRGRPRGRHLPQVQPRRPA